jgi:hypothetical protein
MGVLFQSVWFRLIYLVSLAVYITVLWFVLGPASKVAGATTPWYAVSVACGTFGLVIAVSAPTVVRSACLPTNGCSIAPSAWACSLDKTGSADRVGR